MAITRLAPTGVPDRSFGDHGTTLIRQIGGNDTSRVNALALRRGGRILAAGSTLRGFAIVGLTREGRPDPRFGSAGKVVTRRGLDSAEDIATARGGAIVAAGVAVDANGESELGMARYGRDGELDSDFGSDGILISDFGTGAATRASALALLPDGRIVVAGDVGNNWFLARFLPDGTPDSTFSGDGVTFGAPRLIGQARDLAIDPAGRTLVAGCETGGRLGRFGLARFLPNGELDPAFAAAGVRYTRFSAPYETACANALTLDREGEIWLAGVASRARGAAQSRFAVARYRPNGELSGSFARHGRALIGFRDRLRRRPNGFVSDQATAIGVQGRQPVVAGYSQATRRSDDFAIARLRR